MSGHTGRNAQPRPIVVQAGDAQLVGDLTLPEQAKALIAFAHGSGSSHRSPRNRQVAAALNVVGFATLLFDLLTPAEADVDERSAAHRFDIPLLGQRMIGAVDWLGRTAETRALPIGLFGASTGAAAALLAAAARPKAVGAVVSRGGRPDLAGAALTRVQAPVLLIVGGDDRAVIELNRQALARLSAEAVLELVPGATHLFEEPGALAQVVRLASTWFARHLGATAAPATGS
ncbi:MAG TPA: alpha/beta family hydrolase [Dehalococcoidia bacterium]|nr:alpha/beta family hydrolase [Dehalococcoidia bacterium]